MNVGPFLALLEEARPSGDELRNEERFHAIERIVEPASRQFRTDKDGAVSITSNVDWEEVLSFAEALAGKGRDLRLLVIVARAMTNLDSFAGLAKGLDLLSRSLEGFWDSIHPELRAGPKPDAVLGRLNALRQIENHNAGILGDLEMAAVLTPRGIGPVTGDDLAKATLSEFEFMREIPTGLGLAANEDLKARHAERVNRVRAACRALAEEEPDRAAELEGAVAEANAARARLERIVSEKAGLDNGAALHLGKLEQFLDRVGTALSTLTRKEEDAVDDPQNAVVEPGEDAADMTEGSPTVPVSGSALPTGITSRRDVVRSLDMIIAFYERTEPSSPIPHLARRMRRMVPMNFLQLMEEIAPSGMKEFRNIAGVGDEKGKKE